MEEIIDKKQLTLIDKIRLFENYLADKRDFVLYLPLWVINVIGESKCGFPAYSELYANILKRICINIRSFDPDDYKGGITVKNILKHLGDEGNTYWPDEKELGNWVETNYAWATTYIVTTAKNKKFKEYADEEIFSMAFNAFYLALAEYFLIALEDANPNKKDDRNA